MATGQYLAELAERLVVRGHTVTVVTSSRAYDNHRSGFRNVRPGAASRLFASAPLASVSRPNGAVQRISPPFSRFALSASRSCAGTTPWWHSHRLPDLLPRRLRGQAQKQPILLLVMDFNPDEAIAAGWLRSGSWPAKALDWMSRFSLRHSTKIIALDRFMRDRVVAKGIPPERVAVIPPWSHDDQVHFDPRAATVSARPTAWMASSW